MYETRTNSSPFLLFFNTKTKANYSVFHVIKIITYDIFKIEGRRKNQLLKDDLKLTPLKSKPIR